MLSAKVNGAAQTVQRLNALGAGLVPSIEVSMEREMIRLQAKVIKDKLSGQVLKNRTGNLRRSIGAEVFTVGRIVKGRVYVGREASKYGFVHEYGGTFVIPQHLRRTMGTIAAAKQDSRYSLVSLKLSSLRPGGRHGDIKFGNRVTRARKGFKGDFGVVSTHTATFPVRSFMRSASRELQAVIVANLRADAVKFVKGVTP
jgi:hypothetical protein